MKTRSIAIALLFGLIIWNPCFGQLPVPHGYIPTSTPLPSSVLPAPIYPRLGWLPSLYLSDPVNRHPSIGIDLNGTGGTTQWGFPSWGGEQASNLVQLGGPRFDAVLNLTEGSDLIIANLSGRYFSSGNITDGAIRFSTTLAGPGPVPGDVEHFTILNNGNVGVHINNPLADFHAHGHVLFTGTESGVPVTGAGSRFMWLPGSSAIRAGKVNGSQWNSGEIGQASAAFGIDNKAQSQASTALGSNTTASGLAALSAGLSTTAHGPHSFAGGELTTVNATNSMALGISTTNNSYASVVLGRYNEIANSPISWDPTYPVFVIGNGTDASNPHNALTVLKGGEVGIGVSAPAGLLHVRDGNVIVDGTYTVTVGNSAGATGVAAIALGDNATATGNYSIALGGGNASGSSSMAIMGGTASGTGSMAWGTGIASGAGAFALKGNAVAIDAVAIRGGYAAGTGSVAIMDASSVNGEHSVAIGTQSQVDGDYAYAFGHGTNAQAYRSVVTGSYNVITGTTDSWVSTEPVFVIGNGENSSNLSNAVTVLKNGNVGIGTETPENLLDVAEGMVVGATYAGTESAPTNGMLIEGKIGLGTTTPQNMLDVEGGVAIGSTYSGTNTAPANGLLVEGPVLIGTTSQPGGGSYQLVVAGTGWITSGAWSASDQNFKKNISPIENALSKVLRLEGVGYNWRQEEYPEHNFPSGREIGFIAQQLEEVIPEVVRSGPDGYKGVSYANMVALLTEAIKEQHRIISRIETEKVAENKVLYAENQQLTQDLAQVNTQLQEQESRIAQLEEALRQLTTQDLQLLHRQNSGDAQESGAILYQNNPNPFSDLTKIGYYIPSSTTYAEVVLYVAGSGKEVKRLPVGMRGQGELTVSGRDLESGTYQYVLVIDGRTIESKSMIVVK